jgi:hypothetical protein
MIHPLIVHIPWLCDFILDVRIMNYEFPSFVKVCQRNRSTRSRREQLLHYNDNIHTNTKTTNLIAWLIILFKFKQYTSLYSQSHHYQ